MFRRLSVIAVVVILAAQTGCRSRCDSGCGWFSSHRRADVPCQTVGRGNGAVDITTGQPVPYPSDAPGMVIPGGAFPGPAPGFPNVGPQPDELHMPNPSDMIRPQAVPIPAPGDASLPFPGSPGVPVNGGQNK